MSTPNEPSFAATVWRILWPDIKAGFTRFGRLGIETLIYGVIAWKVLEQLGSKDAPLDSTIERIVVFVVAGLAWPSLHVIWSILSIPWRLYCEQRRTIVELDGWRDDVKAVMKSVEGELAALVKVIRENPQQLPLDPIQLEIQRMELDRQMKIDNRVWNRLTEVRSAIEKHAENAPIVPPIPAGRATAWAKGAWMMLTQNLVDPDATGFNRFIGMIELCGERVSDVIEAKALLLAIASGLKVEHLN